MGANWVLEVLVGRPKGACWVVKALARFMESWIHGRIGAWVHLFMGGWTHGRFNQRAVHHSDYMVCLDPFGNQKENHGWEAMSERP